MLRAISDQLAEPEVRVVAIKPPPVWFPGLIHVNARERHCAHRDASSALQAERIEHDGKRCIELVPWP